MKQRSVVLNASKGVYTQKEVLDLLRKNGISYKIVDRRRSNTSTSDKDSQRSPSSKK